MPLLRRDTLAVCFAGLALFRAWGEECEDTRRHSPPARQCRDRRAKHVGARGADMPQIHGLLVKVKGDGAAFAQNAKHLRAGALEVEPILRLPGGSDAGALAPDRGATWLKVRQRRPRSDNAWDEAHRLVPRAAAFAAAGGPDIIAVEPDFEQVWLHVPPDAGTPFAAAPVCAFDDQSPNGGQAIGPGRGWNFDAGFSQLAMARERVGSKQDKVLVAHLDTGYDPAHVTLPAGIRLDLQRNFVAGFPPDDARDRAPAGSLFANRGHGTGTLGLLAGNKLDGISPGWPGYDGFVGAAAAGPGHPGAHRRLGGAAHHRHHGPGLRLCAPEGAHVLSMSMGGLSSQALVDAVNLAYDSGVVMVTAARQQHRLRAVAEIDRLSGPLPAGPRGLRRDGRRPRLCRPARAAPCRAITARTARWRRRSAPIRRTCRGPQIDCGNIVDMDGAGTSAATPQIAAAAALWLAEHRQRVSTIRSPGCGSRRCATRCSPRPRKSTAKMNAEETQEKIGQGVLKAHARAGRRAACREPALRDCRRPRRPGRG